MIRSIFKRLSPKSYGFDSNWMTRFGHSEKYCSSWDLTILWDKTPFQYFYKRVNRIMLHHWSYLHRYRHFHLFPPYGPRCPWDLPQLECRSLIFWPPSQAELLSCLTTISLLALLPSSGKALPGPRRSLLPPGLLPGSGRVKKCIRFHIFDSNA